MSNSNTRRRKAKKLTRATYASKPLSAERFPRQEYPKGTLRPLPNVTWDKVWLDELVHTDTHTGAAAIAAHDQRLSDLLHAKEFVVPFNFARRANHVGGKTLHQFVTVATTATPSPEPVEPMIDQIRRAINLVQAHSPPDVLPSGADERRFWVIPSPRR